MLILFIICSKAISKLDNGFDDDIFNSNLSEEQQKTNDRKLQQKPNKFNLKHPLKNYTMLKKATSFQPRTNNFGKNSSHHHYHHTNHYHHKRNNTSYDNDNKSIINSDFKVHNYHRHHHLNERKSHKNYYNHHMNQKDKHEYKDASSQIKDEIHGKNLLNEGKKQYIKNKEKKLMNEIMQNKDFINKINQINRIYHHDEKNENNMNLGNNDLNNKILKDEIQSPSQNNRKNNHKHHILGRKKRYQNEQLIHKWEEYQKLNIQQKKLKLEKILQNITNQIKEEQKTIKHDNKIFHANSNIRKDNDKYTKSDSKAIKSKKSMYIIGIIISVGVALAALIIILIFQLNTKKNDELNGNCQKENEDIKKDSTHQIDA